MAHRNHRKREEKKMAEYVLIIHKTNNYPYYEKEEEKFKTFEEAMQRMDEVSKELKDWQDYNLEIAKEWTPKRRNKK